MTDHLIVDERQFLTQLTWGAGSSLSLQEAESKLRSIHYKKIGGIEDLKSVILAYADSAQDASQKERLVKTVEEIGSLNKDKTILLDKLVRSSWIPDPLFYSKTSPKGAEGFSFLTTDGQVMKVLSFRGYQSNEINFFDNQKVPASFILLHEARHLYPDLAKGTTKIFSWKNDPDNSVQNITEEAYSSYIPDKKSGLLTNKLKESFPQLTSFIARFEDDGAPIFTAQTQFSPSVFAGELKADSFAALMSSKDSLHYSVITDSVSKTRKDAFKLNDYNHYTSGALEGTPYVELKTLPQAIYLTNERAEEATVRFISQHPEFGHDVANAYNLCNANNLRNNVLDRRESLSCVKSKLDSGWKH